MGDRPRNLLCAIFFLIFALGCAAIMIAGKTTKTYPIVGVILGGGLCIGFFKNAFRK